MLQLTSRIIIITNKDTRTPGQAPILSYDFGVPFTTPSIMPNLNIFNKVIESGNDVAFIFEFVNDIEIESNFNNLTKTAKITLPRNLKYDNLTLVNDIVSGGTTSLPMFSIGDRIIIQTGYSINEQNTLKEVFRGYITSINIGVPTMIECQDKMFALKRIKVRYPETLKEVQDGKITFGELINRIFKGGPNFNKYMPIDALNIFEINGQIKTDLVLNPNNNDTRNLKDDIIPITYYSGLTNNSITFSTNGIISIAECLQLLKSKLALICYFDDFGNLHFELPNMNSHQINKSVINKKPLIFERQIIEGNLRYQKDYELNLRVVYQSKQTSTKDKTKGKMFIGTDNNNKPDKGYIGDEGGETILINAPDNMSQKDCNYWGLLKYNGEKYTGYVKGSTFTTFGEPALYMSQGIKIESILYPERNGTYFINGVKRSFGVDGYRQIVELGINLDTYKG